MTPEDPESRRIADELARRERQVRQPEASVDAATIRAIIEKHEGEVARIVGQAEAACVERIDALAVAQNGIAESLRREIAERTKSVGNAETAALEERLREDRRVALETLSARLKREFDALKASLDNREGGVFAEIDRVAGKVAPVADVLGNLQQSVAGVTATARDVAAMREAVVDSRRTLDEVANIRQTMTDVRKAVADIVALKPVLAGVASEHYLWNTNARRLRWLGWTIVAFVAVAFYVAGLWTQMETGVWSPAAGSDDFWRDLVWERFRSQLASCINAGLMSETGVACTIGGMER